MDQRVENVLNKFAQGYNCSQSVFSGFAPELGMAEDLALKIAAPFGGGMGRRGEVCGAVSGALMAIGLRHGCTDASDKAAKENNYQLATEFIRRFSARHGTILCRRLLEIDISNPEQLELARQQGILRERCPQFVQTAAQILLDMLEEK